MVPHFNFAAVGGPLRLGTVVKDLLELRPLNKKEADYVPIPDDEIYPPTRQTGFRATRQQALSGQFGVWAKRLGLGAAGRVGGERSIEEVFSCDSIVTTCFDPTDEWVADCLAAKPVDDYIVGSGYKKEVYIITGLKVATNLTFSNEAARRASAEAKVGVHAPQAPVAGGVGGDVSREASQTLGFRSTDIVVGFRVRKYRYKKKSLFGTERKLEDRPFVKGAEMLDGRTRPLTKLNQFEEVPIVEEILAQEEAEAQESPVEECWVGH